MARVLKCEEVTEWIEEEVLKPVETWVEKTEEVCKNWPWPLNWLCKLVTTLVKVVTWVVEIVGKWVTRTICKFVDIVLSFVIDVVVGVIDIVVGIFTWDWTRVWDGFVRIVSGVVGGFFGLVRIVLLGDLIDFIRDEINKKRLRDYVRKLLEARFASDPSSLAAAKDAIGVDFGAFGLRLKATAVRTFVRSDRIDAHDTVPLLIRWHEDPSLDINIRKLAGYDWDSFWKRGRPQVVDASENDVDDYIRDRGGKSFRIYAMGESVLQTKANVAEERARALGLMLEFDTAEAEVTDPAFVRLTGSSGAQDLFNVNVLGRTDEGVDPSAARAELCRPEGGGVFGYVGTFIGYASHLDDSVCVDGSSFPGSQTSGVSFLDRLPDFAFKYVFVHELGHYFGLCHVDGLNRIMYTANKDEDKTWWSWMLIPDWVYLEGGPRFVLDEGKRAWDLIVGGGFPTGCLTTRAH
jgi:hypothetical protein